PAILARPGLPLSIGTDSNLRIDYTEEMRLLEYAQRLRGEKRGIFTDTSGSVAARLFEIATVGGARSLGLRAGEIETGMFADFFTLRIAGTPADDTMAAFVFGAGKEGIGRVAVSGKWLSRELK
ncbi:MAG: amidohydrolase family protein, partial [Vicinamibacteria bacterium]